MYLNMEAIITFLVAHWIWFAFGTFYLLNLALGHKSQLDAWVLKHPKVGGVLKLIRGALPCDPWLMISGISLIIKGTLPTKLMPIVEVISQDNQLPPKQ